MLQAALQGLKLEPFGLWTTRFKGECAIKGFAFSYAIIRKIIVVLLNHPVY